MYIQIAQYVNNLYLQDIAEDAMQSDHNEAEQGAEDEVEEEENADRCVKCNGAVLEAICEDCGHKATQSVSAKFSDLVSGAANAPSEVRGARLKTPSHMALLNLELN